MADLVSANALALAIVRRESPIIAIIQGGAADEPSRSPQSTQAHEERRHGEARHDQEARQKRAGQS